jgi:hypothetical protein
MPHIDACLFLLQLEAFKLFAKKRSGTAFASFQKGYINSQDRQHLFVARR